MQPAVVQIENIKSAVNPMFSAAIINLYRIWALRRVELALGSHCTRASCKTTLLPERPTFLFLYTPMSLILPTDCDL